MTFDPTILQEITPIPTNPELDDIPNKKDIKQALGKMKYDKSPRPNGIPTEVFKTLGGDGLDHFI